MVIGDSSPEDDGTGDPGDMLYDGWDSGSDSTALMNASFFVTPESSSIALLAMGGLMLTRVPCGQPRRRMCSFAHADFAIDVRAAPRTRSTRPSGSAGSASPRQATCWSGRTSTSLWR